MIQTLSNTTLSLVSMTGIFLETAIECVDAFFNRKCENAIDWDVVERLEGQFDLILTIGCANQNYQGILAIGLEKASVPAFVGGDISEFESRDIFGEFANTYCAMLMDRPQFNSRFGILHQSLPVLYSNGQPFLPFISGIQGRVYVDGKWMYIGFAIQKNYSSSE